VNDGTVAFLKKWINKMNKRHITLTRNHLLEWKNNSMIDEITICDFKESAMSIYDLNRAEKIIFVDKGKVKVLKDRFGSPITI